MLEQQIFDKVREINNTMSHDIDVHFLHGGGCDIVIYEGGYYKGKKGRMLLCYTDKDKKSLLSTLESMKDINPIDTLLKEKKEAEERVKAINEAIEKC